MTPKPAQLLADKLRSLILSTLFVALMLMLGVSAITDLVTYRQGLIDKLSTLARAIGSNAAPAILRGDTASATDQLVAFSADPSIMFAQIAMQGGNIFAEYALNPGSRSVQSTRAMVREVFQNPDPRSPDPRVAFHLRYVELVVPLIYRNKLIGAIALHANPSRLYQVLFWQLLATVLLFGVAIAIALRISSRLRRRIEKPIADLATAMTKVSTIQDFDIRVRKSDDDEVGALADGFNEMLSQIRRRDDRLEDYRQELVKRNTELHILATRDPLTNCLNRRAFFEKLGPVFEAARKRGEPLSCMMTDIDRFKSINDTHGHQVGDKVIQTVAKLLSEHLRPRDLLCRYGGEEFCIVLPETPPGRAVDIGERLRKSIEETAAASQSMARPVTFTASFGVAGFEPGIRYALELIARADKALYASKQTGRNRVTLFSSAELEGNVDDAVAFGAERERARRTRPTDG